MDLARLKRLMQWSSALVVGLLLAPLSASALGISVVNVTSSGASPALLEDGDTLTVDLVLENLTLEEVFGLGVVVTGFDRGIQAFPGDDRLQFAGGASASSIFEPVAGFGGLTNQLAGPVLRGGLSPGDTLRVQLFDGVGLDGANGTGQLDTGVDGSAVGLGDVHFRVLFTASTGALPTDVTLDFGVGPFGNAAIGPGGTVLAFANDSLTVRVVPEPGTALLMGLGLAGLASARRR